jgi:ABC-type glycerol-3-phosphate transport system substrate-binding protein
MLEKSFKPLKILLLLAAVLSVFTLSGCKKKPEKRLVIWTDNSEFAPFIEIYNKNHRQKAILVYKENIADNLPPEPGELPPDIIVGALLKNSRIKKNFVALDFLFNRKYLSSNDFYKTLLKYGTFGQHQYLLPVNFNIPAMIFSTENENLIKDNYTISLEELRESGAAFNKKNKKDNYTAIGFAPQSNTNFLYTTAQLLGANFREDKNNSFTWNKDSVDETVRYLKEWISTENTSPQVESDFVYKYLSETPDKQVTSGRTLFSFVTSDKLFSMSAAQLAKLDFRWLNHNGLIPIEDSMISMGIAKHTKKALLASEFISWFFTTETQHIFIERKIKTNLDTAQFGIAGGFSSLKDVNEHILPVYYPAMLTNIPQAGTFTVSDKKPTTWNKIKYRIIIPYLSEAVQAEDGKTVASMEERYSDLKKLGL